MALSVLTAASIAGVCPTLAVAAAPGKAATAGPVLAKGKPHMDKSIPKADAKRLDDAFAEGLSRAGFSMDSGAPRQAVLIIERERSDYSIVAQVTEEDGSVVVSAEAACDLCGIAELDETVRAVAGRLRQRLDLAREGAVVEIETDPEGATVHIDGEIVGVSPVTANIAPGEHEVEAELTGYRTEKREFEATGGLVDHFSLTLKRQGYRTWVPWVLLGGGVALVGTSAVLLAIHDREIRRDCNADIEGNCQFLHNTRGGGATLMVVGAGLVLAGVVTAVAWRRPKSSSSQRARIVPGGIGVRF